MFIKKNYKCCKFEILYIDNKRLFTFEKENKIKLKVISLVNMK